MERLRNWQIFSDFEEFLMRSEQILRAFIQRPVLIMRNARTSLEWNCSASLRHSSRRQSEFYSSRSALSSSWIMSSRMYSSLKGSSMGWRCLRFSAIIFFMMSILMSGCSLRSRHIFTQSCVDSCSMYLADCSLSILIKSLVWLMKNSLKFTDFIIWLIQCIKIVRQSL